MIAGHISRDVRHCRVKFSRKYPQDVSNQEKTTHAIGHGLYDYLRKVDSVRGMTCAVHAGDFGSSGDISSDSIPGPLILRVTNCQDHKIIYFACFSLYRLQFIFSTNLPPFAGMPLCHVTGLYKSI